MNDRDREQFDDELTAKARELAGDVEPERDLWPGIHAAIHESMQGPAATASVFGASFQRYLAQAAAVMLLVGGSSGLTYLAISGDRDNVSPVAAGIELPLDAVSASFGSQYTLGPDFQDARRNVEGRLETELERLSPEARAEVEANIETIRTAIAEINKALAEEPDNVLLQQLLLSSYQEELAVMRKVNGITNTVMLRDDI